MPIGCAALGTRVAVYAVALRCTEYSVLGWPETLVLHWAHSVPVVVLVLTTRVAVISVTLQFPVRHCLVSASSIVARYRLRGPEESEVPRSRA